ncbi:hypothetical protein [Sedimenticola selenatireducens]|uniref:Uncharacterized protein n=1 Tax=Sedimenticola selenatireducens TaxID=191960 RepID=A0A558DWT7_9GAMM|nr:hypothetical protein [Sedimenticola selenatireducens]TVO75477.1 hypothetical protein FHP88_08260 [Sedimenticola selenatireducens]TVT65383.1 MAG: hypothetical protein FHK78_04045 [Sedimenticola selenatireducens]
MIGVSGEKDMKHFCIFMVTLVLLGSSASWATEIVQPEPDFLDFVPEQKYPLNIPEGKMRHFLPYAYLKLSLPSTTKVPFSAKYWVNVNKQNMRVSHVTLEVPLDNPARCVEIEKELKAILFKEGFKPAEPDALFFDLVAKRGKLVARMRCSMGAIPASEPSRRLPPKVRLTVTTAEEHHQFEETMRNVRH